MKYPEEFRVMGKSDCPGAFMIPINNIKLAVIASDECDWDHVSVSLQDRCPTWEEMCEIKDIFFGEKVIAIQIHPSDTDYINIHPYCLHIWRPQNIDIPLPPKILV